MTEIAFNSSSIAAQKKTPVVAGIVRAVAYLGYILRFREHPSTRKWREAGDRLVEAALADHARRFGSS